MRGGAAVTLLLLACGGGAAPPAKQATGDSARGGPPVDTTFPTARRGMLAAHPAGLGGLGGEWSARAARCANPSMLQVLARGDTVDLLIVLWLPADSAATGSYPVLSPSDSTVAPRTARMGAQRMLYADLSYRASGGTVWLERLDRWASGRFDVVLDESMSHDQVRYLGTFSAVPVDSAPEPACRPAPRDSAGARGPRPMLD